ncbi:MAG: hypothetical protein QME79_00315 [Bacillota bacterium]|nr:hypothetical protein [Bacillota bacterium]
MSHGRPRRWPAIILTALVSAASVLGAAFGVAAEGSPPAVVREVKVELASQLPEVVAERIREALAAVATKALQGQEVATVERSRPAVEKVVAEVFDRVLAGYKTTAVTVIAGETTEVKLHVVPVAPVIREVYTRLEVEGVDPALQPLLREAVTTLDAAAGEILGGLPVAAFTWARFTLEPLLEQELERHSPGFRVEAKLEAGEVTTITARLVPQGPLVHRVNVQLRSETVPAVALRQLSAELDSRGALMVGLPVAFLNAYRVPIQQEIERRVRETPSIAQWGLQAKTRLVPGVQTTLEVGVESTAWRLRLEGVVSAGAEAPGPELRMLGGWSAGPGELLVGSRLLLTGLKTFLHLGVGVPVGWEGQLSYLWNLEGGQMLRFQKRISAFQRWGFEREYPGESWRLSYGVAANEYLTVDLVAGGGKVWLALVGNL